MKSHDFLEKAQQVSSLQTVCFSSKSIRVLSSTEDKNALFEKEGKTSKAQFFFSDCQITVIPFHSFTEKKCVMVLVCYSRLLREIPHSCSKW